MLQEIRSKKKITVLQLQRLCGYLNFLCKAIVPGRAFTSRLYSKLAGKSGEPLKKHYHISVNEEMKLDILVWENFLQHQSAYCRPFMDFTIWTAEDIQMYSDASKSLGFGGYCGDSWLFSGWPKGFIEDQNPSIDYLELFGVAAVVLKWIYKFKNRRILLHCDNEGVCFMLNKSSGKCKNTMVLMRLITLECMIHNVRIFAEHLSSEENLLSDALSRLDLKRFFDNAPDSVDQFPSTIPEAYLANL